MKCSHTMSIPLSSYTSETLLQTGQEEAQQDAEFPTPEHNTPLLWRFFRLSMAVLLILRADCSLFTSKPAHSSPYLPGGSVERRRLSFRALDVEQIGHVYEG